MSLFIPSFPYTLVLSFIFIYIPFLSLSSSTCFLAMQTLFITSNYNKTSSLMMKAAHTSETSVDNYFTRQYIPEYNSELQ
jgi:hypothetical protein